MDETDLKNCFSNYYLLILEDHSILNIRACSFWLSGSGGLLWTVFCISHIFYYIWSKEECFCDELCNLLFSFKLFLSCLKEFKTEEEIVTLSVYCPAAAVKVKKRGKKWFKFHEMQSTLLYMNSNMKACLPPMGVEFFSK